MSIWLYLETAPGSNVYNCRGECGPGDDPVGFERRLNERRPPGQRYGVFVRPNYVGDKVRLLFDEKTGLPVPDKDGHQKLEVMAAGKNQAQFGG